MKYEAPGSFDEAVALLNGETGTSRILAGGTDVLVQLRSGMVEPDLIVDIKRIPGVYDVTAVDGGWKIGAAVPGAALNENAAVKADWPGVVEALDLIGSTQVQGRATLVGNLCNGSPAADSVPAMVAAGVTVTVTGADGSREVAVEDGHAAQQAPARAEEQQGGDLGPTESVLDRIEIARRDLPQAQAAGSTRVPGGFGFGWT